MKAAHAGVLAVLGVSMGWLGVAAHVGSRCLQPPAAADSRDTRAHADRAFAPAAPVPPPRVQQPVATAAGVPARQRADTLARRLWQLLRGAHADEDELSRAQADLLALGELAAAPLLDLLEAERDTALRDRLLDVLRKVPGPVAESGLIQEARWGRGRTSRALSIEALGQRRTPAAFEALDHIARSDPELPARPLIIAPRADDANTELPDETVFTPRMQAMQALASTRDLRTLSTLTEILRSERDESLRMQAARYLGAFNDDPDVVAALTAAASADASPYVRLAALHSLEGLDDETLISLLTRIAARDSHAGVRLLANRLLQRLRATPHN
ncbi:MAG TPA: HEAT repeat domain-containing protein [Polyangiaceae bacterium]|nr:HEAT repeat domain-containing protein [Polyangiaceae bacterium]